jgi:hypothetical protein
LRLVPRNPSAVSGGDHVEEQSPDSKLLAFLIGQRPIEAKRQHDAAMRLDPISG